MADIVVTCPKSRWAAWLAEGDLPGEEAQYESHFWMSMRPICQPGDRVYIVAHGRLRGYAPLVRLESRCQLDPSRSCLVRAGGSVAVTISESIPGFRGFRYRFWNIEYEVPFPDFATAGVS